MERTKISIKEIVARIRAEILELEAQKSEKEKLIDRWYLSCDHSWTEPEKKNYKSKSFFEYDKSVWNRECKICGKIETTERSSILVIPDFNNMSQKQT